MNQSAVPIVWKRMEDVVAVTGVWTAGVSEWVGAQREVYAIRISDTMQYSHVNFSHTT